jgi:hypothetical protein
MSKLISGPTDSRLSCTRIERSIAQCRSERNLAAAAQSIHWKRLAIVLAQ